MTTNAQTKSTAKIAPPEPRSYRVAETWDRPLVVPDSMPPAADVVIIGGGIVGVATAWFLARQGINVVLCEKGHIAGEQSGRNWGWVRQQGRDTREMPMIVEALKIWRGLADEIGEDVGFREQGVLFSIASDRQAEQYAEWIEAAKQHGIESRIIDARTLRRLVRGAAVDWQGAMYTPSDGRAEPHKATAAIARAAVREGASLLTGCAVRGIETAAGRAAAVVTEHGTIRTGLVLCAAGAWTSMFCRSLGVSVPQLQVRGTVARTAPADDVCDGNFYDDRIALRRRDDGGYTLADGLVFEHAITPASFRYASKFMRAMLLEPDAMRLSLGREFIAEWKTPKRWSLDAESPFEKVRVLDPAPSQKVLGDIRKSLAEVFPTLAEVPFVETWAGMIETTPDVVPIIDEVEAIPGLHIATGFSGHGFGIGPGAGKAIAAMLTGDKNAIDLSEFRLSRFFDGTPIRPQSSV